MCGIAGFVTRPSTANAEAMPALAEKMATTLCHRGPDHGGTWCDPEEGVAFGHRRLAIIDLSPEGQQPMISASGRYVLIYNGEIYNFQSLRAKLEDKQATGGFRGHSDTEVMLAAFDAWGIRAAVEQFNGMFAFAVWDRRLKKLVLGRDRLGEKPLYYGWCGEAFLFGSELKSFHAHPSFKASINRRSVALYTRYGYVPSGHSIYEGIRKLSPATILEVSSRSSNGDLVPTPYWSPERAASEGLENPLTGGEHEVSQHLEELLLDAVRIRMVADVPLGAFLSGGVDSSTVVALMQAQSDRPIKTFSIGFHEASFNEAPHAERVARHLRTDHTQLYVVPEDALAVIPKLPEMYDEPFSDASQIPTFLVSRLARQSVTVALSGDGGDELFGGYTRHLRGPALWRSLERLPLSARAAAARMLRLPGPNRWSSIERSFGGVVRRYSGNVGLSDAVNKVASVLELAAFEDLYLRWVSTWPEQDHLLIPERSTDNSRARLATAGLTDLADQMMFLDLITYLTDDILTKVDRASMAVSLEARVPLLDHRVVELAWRIPRAMKIRDGRGKRILRRVLYRYVPRELIERPKTGFGLPIGEWLRGPLRSWADSLLGEDRLRSDGFFDATRVRDVWREHLAQKGRYQDRLWNILMFQAWLDAAQKPSASELACA